MTEKDEFLSLPEIAAQIEELEAKLDARYKALREPASSQTVTKDMLQIT